MAHNYPPVLVGLACGDLARYSDFIPSIVGLNKPAGSGFKKVSSLGPAKPWNIIAQAFLDHPEYRYLFLTNDDNMCPPDAIYRLMDRNVDVVSGLYFGRIMPFEPILFDRWTWEMDDPESHARDCYARLNTHNEVERCDCGTAIEEVKHRWWHRHLMQPGEHGLIRAAAVGDGCLLIKRKVIERMLPPWWEYGETLTDVCDHDVVFSRKVVEAGFGLYCDLDVVVDHMAAFTIRPHRTPDGKWECHLTQDGKKSIVLPAAHKGMPSE